MPQNPKSTAQDIAARSRTDPVAALLALMARLRDPETGCPWDVEQDFATIAPYTVEEAYEVADAIARNDMDSLKDELGDLLLQVVFHARIASERGLFSFDDVARQVTDKMIHRHPHVFGEERATGAADVENRIWEERKAKETRKQDLESVLDDVPSTFPAVLRAQKLQKRAARTGFEWARAADVLEKLEEEIKETREAIEEKNKNAIHEELGDMLFCVVNFGRMLGVDCETALQDANRKFERRFRGIERHLKEKGKDFSATSLAEMEEIWQQQKRLEKEKSGP